MDTSPKTQRDQISKKTMRFWACQDIDPIRSRRINYRLELSIVEIRALLAVAYEL
jgi:hypothetical protein